jgi:hypothetical protein
LGEEDRGVRLPPDLVEDIESRFFRTDSWDDLLASVLPAGAGAGAGTVGFV